jgi:hypothetical protein
MASQQAPDESETQASSSTQVARRSGGHTWHDEHAMFFLEMLLQARRDGALNNLKENLLRSAFQGILPLMEAKFDGITTWSIQVLVNRHRYVRDYWRTFLEALGTSGTDFDKVSGMLTMEPDRKDQFLKSHKRYGKKVLTQPLPRNEAIDIDQWMEIFSNDQPAGGHIFEPGDLRSFRQVLDEAIENSQAAVEELPASPVPDDEAFGVESEEVLEVEEIAAAGEEDTQMLEAAFEREAETPSRSTSTSSSRTQSRGRAVRSSNRRQLPANTALRGLKRGTKNTPRASRPPDSLDPDLRAAMISFLSRPSQLPQSLGLAQAPRIPGAVDLETAVKTARHFARSNEGISMQELLMVIEANPTNAVMWNSLDGTEERLDWLELKLGRSLRGSP